MLSSTPNEAEGTRGSSATAPLPEGSSHASTDAATLSSQDSRILRLRLSVALLLIAALLFAGLYFRQKRLLISELNQMATSVRNIAADQAQLERYQSLLQQRQKDLRTANALIGMMAAPETHSAALAGSAGRGQVFVSSSNAQLALFVFDLPEPKDSAQLQAFASLEDGTFASLGVLPAALDGVRTLFTAPPGRVKAVVITQEAAPGKLPSGPVVLQATLPTPPLESPRGAVGEPPEE